MNKHDEAKKRTRRLFNNHSLKFEDGDNVPKIKHYYEENEKYINECAAIEKELKQLQKKEVGMKVLNNNDPYVIGICPMCGSRFEHYEDTEYTYCPGCGQKLDWGEEEIK